MLNTIGKRSIGHGVIPCNIRFFVTAFIMTWSQFDLLQSRKQLDLSLVTVDGT